MTRLGLDVVAAGVAFGLVVLVVFAIARIGTAGKSRPPVGTADHRRGTAGPQPAASHGHGKSSGRGTSQGHRQDRLRAGAPAAGSGHGGRDGGARSGRPPVLNPTNVYTPGGLLDVPRDGRAPGTAGGQAIPEILRTAGPPPPGGQEPRDRRPAGGARTGRRPAGPGLSRRAWLPAARDEPGRSRPGAVCSSGGQPPPPMPPRDHMRPREAPRPGQAMPPREGMPAREPMPPRGAAPAQKPQAAREAPGRATPALPATPACPATACLESQWGPAARSARAAPRHLATPLISLRRARASTNTKAARPGGMRAVPATPLPAAAGQESRGTRHLRDPPGLLRPLASLTAGTPTSSARRITRPGRPTPRARRPSAGPQTRPGPAEPGRGQPQPQASRPRPAAAGCVRLPGHQWPAR